MKLHDLFREAAKVVRVIDTGIFWQITEGDDLVETRFHTRQQAELQAAWYRARYVVHQRIARALRFDELLTIKQHTGRGGCWRANCRAALREIEGRKQKYRGVEV